VRFNLIENDSTKLQRMIQRREIELQDKVNTLKQVNLYIEQLSGPFGFL
jgi:hypothetical protein